MADGPSSFGSLPMLSAARVKSAGPTKDPSSAKDDQTLAINSLVKTLNATVTKLLFSFSAINAASTESSCGTIELALKAAKREELSGKIVDALSNTVERVVRCDKAAVRSSVLRDLRARFTPTEKPKAEMIDCGVQTAARKPSKKDVAAAAAEAAADAAILKQLQQPAEPSTTFITAATSARRDEPAPPPPPPAAAATSDKPLADDSDKPSPRPASAMLPGIYERQMEWKARAAANKERMRVEKENKEREAEAPLAKAKSSRWAHVESVMRKERRQTEETWKSELREQMEAERERRDQIEARLKDEREAREALAAAKAKADAQRAAADERAAASHQRMLEAEKRYAASKQLIDAQAKSHAEALEIRDAFGERGLEEWPMFPGRKVFRVLESDYFDGRVSAEFRVKDAESGERGVTLLMGRLAHGKVSEAQAVLFESKAMSDLDAARWWAAHGHRFERAKERALAQRERASSAGPSRLEGRRSSNASTVDISPRAT